MIALTENKPILDWDGINWNCIDWGSVADWVSGIGSILAIIFVILQIKQSKEQLNEQLRKEKENAFRIERPLFKIELSNWADLNSLNKNFLKISKEEQNDIKKYVFKDDYIDSIKEKFQHRVMTPGINKNAVYIKNISDKSILALECHIKVDEYIDGKDKKESYCFRIDKVSPDEKVILLLLPGSNIEGKMVIYFTTAIREKIRLVFQVDNSMLQYRREEKWLENKDGQWPQPNSDFEPSDESYSLDNFQETKYFK